MRACALLGLLALAACTANIPEGKLACSTASDCPEDWLCLEAEAGLRCFSSEEAREASGSAGTGGSGSGGDASPPDGGGTAGAGGMSGSAGDDAGGPNAGSSGDGGEPPEAGSSGGGAGSPGGTGGGGAGDSGSGGGGTGGIPDLDMNLCEAGTIETCGVGALDCDEVGSSYTCICGEGYSGTDTIACTDIDECGRAHSCTDDYPCRNLSPFYTCVGRFPDWRPDDSPSPSPFGVNGSGSDATVSDSRTGLEWRRTVSASTFTFQEAKQHCIDLGSGWRLPTRAELESIVDFGNSNPAIDEDAFPNTPAAIFWSSSPWAADSLSGWATHFRYGNTYGLYFTDDYRARCVR